MQRGRILVVDDDAAMAQILEQGLQRRQFQVLAVTSAEQALHALEQNTFDVVLTDMNMPVMGGIALCERITSNIPNLPVVVITAFGHLDAAISAIRAGAYDFVVKPFELDAMGLVLDRAVSHRALREEVQRLRSVVREQSDRGQLIGESAPMLHLHDLMTRVAHTDATLLLSGETGTGKELVASRLHQLSHRRNGPFVAINCSAIPELILESELFGHARGAFTDAKSQRDGLFVEASGGTLFLDEIGDMPLSLQPKLLRVLQQRTVRPVGTNQEIPIDVRIIAATHRDLDECVERGLFRQDLLYRINVIQLHIPPLRARGQDVLLLAQHYVTHFAERFHKHVQGFTSAAAQQLLRYAWPGNVRELQNCIERAVALCRYDHITPEDLPETIQTYQPTQLVFDTNDEREFLPLAAMEKEYIQRALQKVGGNKALAARLLGVDRKTLYRKLEQASAAS